MDRSLQPEEFPGAGLLAYQLQPAAADGGSQPPYEEDFFQRIVNVNWAAGLAVEFNAGSA